MSEPEVEILDRRCSDDMCRQKGEYRTRAECSNCGWKGVAIHTQSHKALGGQCPKCGCDTVRYPFINGAKL